MSTQPAQQAEMDRALAQMDTADRQQLAAARQRLADRVPQGQEVDRSDTAQLPVGRTPQHEAKDLVAKYGRSSPSMAPDREPSKEPDND